MNYEAKLVLDAKAGIAETPIWHPEKKVLYWTDVFTGDFHIFNPVSQTDKVFKTDCMIGSAIPCEDGHVLLLLDSGLHLLNPETRQITKIVDVEPESDANRLNDGRCDAKGRVWFSTVSKLFGSDDFTEDMTGALYMVDTDLSLHKVVDGIHQLNGIGWSKDNRRMYVVDTYNFKLFSFDYNIETGQASGMSTAAQIPEEFSYADGLCIDDEDYVWIAHWGGRLSKWNPVTGELVETVPMPVPHVTCCGFGGDAFNELYITTSKFGISEDDLNLSPLCMSGGLFRINPGVRGRETYMFKGKA